MTALPNAINDAVVGQQVQAFATFYLPDTQAPHGLVARYEITDADDAVWTSGIATNLVTSPSGSKTKVIASASVNIPYTLPVEFYGTKYQLAWSLTNEDGQIVSTFIEAFNVKPVLQAGVYGVPDIVEANTAQTELIAVLPSNEPVEVICFKQNSMLGSAVTLQPGNKVFNGTEYTGVMSHAGLVSNAGAQQAMSEQMRLQLLMRGLTPSNTTTTGATSLTPSLEPYNLYWQYVDEDSGSIQVQDSYLYHVTPMILQAAKELQQRVNRANNVGRLEELTIDLNVIIPFLKQGGDMFNSVGMPTYFNFTKANGPFRHFWVSCAAVLLLRSQYLMEAERSMVMQGQSVTLDLDITQYYETAAADAESFVDKYLPEFKQNLNRKGIVDGDGDYEGGALSRNTGAIGIQLSATTNLYFGWRNYYSRRGLF